MKGLVGVLLLLICCGSAKAQEFIERFGFQVPTQGYFRSCSTSQECNPSRDCSQTTDCSMPVANCRQCIAKFPGGKICINDPACEASNAARRTTCEYQKTSARLQCEAEKSVNKLACEANKTTALTQCQTTKEQEQAAAQPFVASFSAVIKLEGRPWVLPTNVRQIVEEVLGGGDLSSLRFFREQPTGFANSIQAWLQYGGGLIDEKALPKVAWIQFTGAQSFSNTTVLKPFEELSIGEAFRSAIVYKLFQMRPEELAQLKASDFDFQTFINRARNQICQGEKIVDKKIDCDQIVSLVRE
ncbi:hypothetical protein NLM27_27390 [Bradyrhizobium sp. CCGB12]|uniref:hypothetical protein n=1 Tax=Bradyrhizobium sp. CCGB12 TaxID=2949632 RepID=UPI0020B286BE|nr:hypothetical protein [Bradyrhizobium sp. CCGB12]MCP3392474.1 hypothetical protein [Bradyrhizobium sp. CCGB12]